MQQKMDPRQDPARQAAQKPKEGPGSRIGKEPDASGDNPFLQAQKIIQAREQLNPFALAAQKFGLDAYLQMKPEVKDPIVVHTVLKGENVYQIARFYGSTVAELVALNDLKEKTVDGQNHIHIQTGDQLKVYDRRKGKRVSESTQEERIGFHKVEAQETAYGIANKYSMTVDELARLNQLQVQSKNGAAYVKIKAGEFLRVYSDGNVLNLGLREIDHPVVEGDSLYGLSITYGVEEDEIKAHNDLESDTIKIGEVLKIPLGKAGEKAAEQKEKTSEKKANKPIFKPERENVPDYTFQLVSSASELLLAAKLNKSLLLYDLNKALGLDYKSLKELNSKIDAGQKLAPGTLVFLPTFIHPVEKGQTAFSIFQDYYPKLSFKSEMAQLLRVQNLNAKELPEKYPLLLIKRQGMKIPSTVKREGEKKPEEQLEVKGKIKQVENSTNWPLSSNYYGGLLYISSGYLRTGDKVFKPGTPHGAIDLVYRTKNKGWSQTYGAPVYSTHDGKVSGIQEGWGAIFIVREDGLLGTTYGHLSRLEVKVGDTVKKGQKIGELGSKGTEYAHLHFEIYKGKIRPKNRLKRTNPLLDNETNKAEGFSNNYKIKSTQDLREMKDYDPPK